MSFSRLCIAAALLFAATYIHLFMPDMHRQLMPCAAAVTVQEGFVLPAVSADD